MRRAMMVLLAVALLTGAARGGVNYTNSFIEGMPRGQVGGPKAVFADEAARLLGIKPARGGNVSTSGTVHKETVPGQAPGEEGRLDREAAAALADGDTTRALERWGVLLRLPEGERRARSVRAAFMIGRTCAESDPERAIIMLAECRRLAAAGFADPEGLATVTLEWQARAELAAGQTTKAMTHALELVRRPGAAPDFKLLEKICNQAAGQDEPALLELAQDAAARAVLTAHCLASEDKPAAARWLKVLDEGQEEAGPAEKQALARLALQAGDAGAARRWMAEAGQMEGGNRWMVVSLLLGQGEVGEAAAELDTLRFEAAPGSADARRACGLLAAIRLSQDKFVEALEASVDGGRWEDVAFLAERVLTSTELEKFLEERGATLAKARYVMDSGRSGALGPRLGALLGRRLAREGEWARARKWLAQGAPELAAEVDRYVRNQAIAAAGTDDRLRAAALFEAARVIERRGLALLGTELAPDWVIYGGRNGGPDPGTLRLRKNDPTDPSDPSDPTDRLSKALMANQGERERLAASAAGAGTVRRQAAAMMWDCAGMLPDNDPLLAAALWHGGRAVAGSDPAAADRFYKALVRRCGALEAGRQAARARWFPKEAPRIPEIKIPVTVYVRERGDDANDGASWATAKRTLGAAIATARLTGGEVWAAAGRYPEAVRLEEGVAVYGGFRGVETTLTQRRLDLAALSVIDAATAEGGRPARHAVLIDGIHSAFLDGFQIRGGEARGPGAEGCGGGVFSRTAGPGVALLNCVITENTATARGGGLFITSGTLALTSCTLAGNRAGESGGGLAVAPAGRAGLTGCALIDNGARFGDGGGVFAEGGLSLSACELTGNWANEGNGGGAALAGTVTVFEVCALAGNTAGAAGGAVWIGPGTAASLRHCLVTGNRARRGGGAWLEKSRQGEFMECTFVDNAGDGIGVKPVVQASAGMAPPKDGKPELKVEHCLFNANLPAHLRLGGGKACLTAREINAALGGSDGNAGGNPRLAPPRRGRWTALPYYNHATGTTVLVDRDADFSGLTPGQALALRPDDGHPTTVAVVAVRGRTVLEAQGDLTRLAGLGSEYQLTDHWGLRQLGSHGFDTERDTAPPISAAGPLPSQIRSRVIEVPFSYRDEQRPPARVRLFFRKDGGPWRAGGVAAPGAIGEVGRGTIRFDATRLGDGRYEFHTVATDAAGNMERAKSKAEAWTMIAGGG